MENEKRENEMTNEQENNQLQLADLPIENEEQVKGGPNSNGGNAGILFGNGGQGVVLNHNETTAEDDETEALTDLPVTDEQEEHVTGGSTIVGHTTISNPSGSATNIPAQIIAR